MRHLTKQEIIEKGLCIDDGLCMMCGLCVSVCPPENIKVVFPDKEPELSFGDRCNDCGLCYQVCPGRDVPLRDLDRFICGKERDPERDLLGLYIGCYQANAVDSEIRKRGAAGGTVSALLTYALEKGLIGGATVAAMDEEVPWRIKPIIAKNRAEVLAGSGTKSVIVPMNSVLAKASPEVGKLGCVGLACHIHGLRKLQHRFPNNRLTKQISFTLGVCCGTNGPYRRVEYYLKERCNVDLDDIKSMTYRSIDWPWRTQIVKKNGEKVEAPWYVPDVNRFIRHRCSQCLDWSAEVADVSVGDLYTLAAEGSDAELGANVLLVRTKVGEDLVNGAVDAGYLKIYPAPVGVLALSAGFRQKKYFAMNRFLDFKKYNWLTPDYQYPLKMTPPVDRRGFPEGFLRLPLEERQRILKKRGTAALWFK
ncbi:Coenzyme F420 hydrogenase/dehydrogenase, beta subunit C-terminal domain [Chloroflexota bacterium]